MNRYIVRRTRRFAVLAGGMTLAVALYMVALLLFPFGQESRAAARIAAHALQNELEGRLADGQSGGLADGQADGQAAWPKSDFAYAVYDLRGHILASTFPEYQRDIDVRLLSTAREYTAPLIVNGELAGILIADIPENPPWSAALLRGTPAMILCAAILVLLARHWWFVKTDIIRPLDELHGVVGRMVEGDLGVPVSYHYDGEMGTFCHDFETMRVELLDAAERERRHQEKERLLFASLSHDLKTPLSSISGYAESIRYGVVKGPADIERYSDIILRKTKDLTHSIEDILTHVQAQMHEMSVKKEELYARPFFDKLLADATGDAAAHGLTLESHAEIPNPLISVDPMRIAQVFQNIIGNAVKYTASGGRILVTAEAGKDEMRFSIEDSGCGIRPEDAPFIFEPFFRSEKSRNPNVSGSGLGLSIAKYIVERHGGQITCESVAGEGTKIAFSIAYF